MFNYNREVGLQLRSSFGEKFVIRPHLRFTLGDGRNIVTINHGGFQYIARVEVLPFGKFSKGNEVLHTDFVRESKPKMLIGLTYDFNDNAARQKGNAGRFLTDTEGNMLYSDTRTILADIVFKYQGVFLNGTFGMREAASPELGFHEATGFNVEGGYLFKNNMEVAMRYSQIDPMENNSAQGSREYLFGLSKYINKHPLKAQMDIGLIENPSTDVATIQYRFQITAGF